MQTRSDPLEQFLRSAFYAIGGLCKQMWYGVRRLRGKKAWIGLGVSAALAVAAYCNKPWFLERETPAYTAYVLWGLALSLPLLYLILLGSSQRQKQNQYQEAFAAVSFVGKDKKYPWLLWGKEEEKKEILCFQSSIPIPEWRNRKADIETALDKRILSIQQAGSKRRVKLVVVDSSHELPTMLRWNDECTQPGDGVIVLGETELAPVICDLNSVPHILCAGETGSGKSVELRCIAWQLIVKGAVMFILDFKGGVEFGIQYEQYAEVITTPKESLELLELLDKENNMRQELFRMNGVKNLKEYNDKTGDNLSRIGLLVDELAELMDRTGASKDEKGILEGLQGKFSTFARTSRATGINLLLGAQRPDHKVVTGQIKTNVTGRICGRFADNAPSEIVLGNTMAKNLPDTKGRFLYRAGADTVEFQAYFFEDSMLKEVDLSGQKVLLPELQQRCKGYLTAAGTGAGQAEPTQQPAARETQPPEPEESELDLDFNF